MAQRSEPVFPDLRDDQILSIGIYGETVAAYRYDVLAEKVPGEADKKAFAAISQEEQEVAYPLSRCIACGCCLEACPQYTSGNSFVGAAVISQARRFNEHPIGKALKPERLDVLMEEGGVTDCGKAQNCAAVCPKQIPLMESIAAVQSQATVYAIKRFFRK